MQDMLSEKILNKNFDEVKTGFMGGKVMYSQKEVDAYLQELSLDIEQCEKTIKNMERKMELMESQNSISSQFRGASEEELSQIEKELSEKKRHVDRMEKSFTRMVIMAETQADELREEAKKESKIILNESKLRAEELLKEARRRHDAASLEATEIIEDAKKRREDINGQYDEVKKELVAIYEFIEKAVLGENSQIKTIFAEKAKQAIVNE